MIKLKKLLKEDKYAFDRKFGDPLPTFKDVMETHQNKPKEQIIESIDLQSHYHRAKSHVAVFDSNIDARRGGSFDTDSVEYEDDRWNNDSKMLKRRDKKLGQWENKVKKALDGLMNDYVKAWK